MPARVYKTDKEQLLAEGKLIVSSTADAKFQHKVELVNLVLSGMTPSALSEFVCESKNTIKLWVKTADEKGFDALRTKKQTGRPSKLSAENIASIKSVLEEDNPKKYGFNVWDGPALSAYISREYGSFFVFDNVSACFTRLDFLLCDRRHSHPKPRKA